MHDNKFSSPAELTRDKQIVANSAEALNTAKNVWKHAITERLSDLTEIMKTVATNRPLIYVIPEGPFGPVKVMTEPKDVQGYYKGLYESWLLTGWSTIYEIRSPWYVFFDGVYTFDDHKTGEKGNYGRAINIFPMCEQTGILGEMVWYRWPETETDHELTMEKIGVATERRLLNLSLYEEFLKALRASDAVSAASCFHPKAQMAARTPAEPKCEEGFRKWDGKSEIEQYYQNIFDSFEVEDLEEIKRLTEEWYIFLELRWVLRDRSNGRRYTTHTADLLPIVAPGKFSARAGYGTALIEL